MRVCHVTSVHPPFDGRIFLKECCSLAQRYDTTLIAPNVEDQELNGVHIKGVTLPLSRIKRMMHLGRVYDKMKEVDTDVYHFHDPELIPLGVRIKKEKGKKIVFDSHEDVPLQISEKDWIPAVMRKPLHSVYATYERSALRKYTALISVTPSIVERLASFHPHTYMVTNYPIFSEQEDKREFGNYICFAGGISAQWMHEEILDAIADLNVRYLLAGKADSEAYLQRLKSKDSWDKVDFYGKIPYHQVAGLMEKSTAGIVLNDYVANVGYHQGSLGNTKLFENMMCGIPVIATDFVLWKEIIDNYHCGICVNPHDIHAIADAIKYLTSHPEEARQMGENGRRAVKEKYNWGTQEKVLFELYDALK